MRFKEYKNGGKAAGDRKTYAYNYLISKGVPSVQAAGIIGNLAAESGLNTTIIGKADDKKSVGLAQWHSERKTGLYNFAKKQGTGWDSLETQLDYILHELNTTEKRAKKSLFSAKTPKEATLAFMNDYERPAEWAKKQSSKERVNEALQLSGLNPDPNYTYNSEDKSTQQSDPYQFREIKSTDYYAPQVSQNISSLDNTQETTNLAEDKAAEIKNRLDQKKAEKAFIEQMIKATQVAYVNPEDYQSKPTFEEPQEQMFQQGGISQFKKQPFQLKNEVYSVSRDATNIPKQQARPLQQLNVRNKTDKEIAQEREARIQASIEAQKTPYTKENWRQQLAAETAATGDKLRVSNSPNFFDDYINPAVMIGDMASNLGQAPYQAQQSDSVLPYLTAIGTPLAVGAMAGIRAKTTGQFANNIVNPLAGTGDLVNNLGNKYLPNAYKLNPKAFKTSTDKFYRQVDNTTYNEGIESGLIKGKQDVDMTRGEGIVNLNKAFGDDAYYNKGSLYYKNNKDLPYLFEAGLPEDRFIPKVNGRTRKFTTENTSVRVSREPIPINDPNITLYKKDWLQGYKQVEVPKTTQSFKSEINWGNWNKEIPENPQLMNEYNLIEETSKSNGSWMKNPDGSAFQGTPEQFVQQNSESFKKSFPNGFEKTYRGTLGTEKSVKNIRDNRATFTANEELAKRYAGRSSKGNILGYESDLNEYAVDGVYQLAYPKTKNSLIFDANNSSWENINLNNLPKSGISDDLIALEKRKKEFTSKYDQTVKTDDIAAYVEKSGVDNITIKNINDSGFGDVSVVSHKPGNYLKSLVGNNGMFDMNNPNIYKSVIPIAGASYLANQNSNEFQQGGIIEDDRGQWAFPGEITKINSGDITMEGVDYPVYGVDNLGNSQMMYPNQNYKFPGTSVTEYPQTKARVKTKRFSK